MGMNDIKRRDAQYVAHTYARFPIHITEGEGSVVTDDEGKEYIDLGSGIAVNTFGVCDKVWQKAVIEQLGRVQHASNLYFTDPCVRLAEMLCARTGMSRVFFSNSGAESNECAIKAARKYAAQVLGTDYTTIITLKNSFHGRTITTLAATGQDVFHKDFQPLTPGFVHATPNDLADLERLLNENRCAAVMMELVQGEGGVRELDAEFVKGAERLAHEHGALVVIDEVQTGNGRTGKLYAYMHYGIQPDIVSTAKGLGGGLPIGATMFNEKTADILGPGDHGSTFGGNPVSCAGAVSILERIDDALLSRVQAKSNMIRTALTGAPGVEEVTGLGLMLGVKTARPAGDVVAECMENGVLVLKAKDRVRLLPALNIPEEQLQKAVKVLRAACAPKE